MRRHIVISTVFLLSLSVLSCFKDPGIDKEKPVIDLSIEGAFPLNCDTLYFGQPFVFKALFTDNVELGSFSIDIHDNFNHHSHSTEVEECEMSPQKVPVNPFVFIREYALPEGLSKYDTNLEIAIPSGNSDGPFDEGDYHFMVRLTDKTGWSTFKGISIKIKK